MGILSYLGQHIAREHKLETRDKVFVEVNKVTIAQQWAAGASNKRRTQPVLKQYQAYLDVFSEEAAK